MIDAIQELIAQSLVVTPAVTAGKLRYQMLESLRAFALERLREAAEEVPTATALTEFVEHLVSGPPAPDHAAVEAEIDNLRFALRWTMDAHAAANGVRLLVATTAYWQRSGRWIESDALYRKALLSERSDLPPVERARLLLAAGAIATYREDFTRSINLFQEAHEACPTGTDDTALVSRCMNSLAAASYNLGSYDAAERLWLDSLRSLESGNHQAEAAHVHSDLALLAWQVRDDYRTASTLYDRALATFRVSGDHFMIAFTLANIAETAFAQGDFAQARQAAGESLTLFDALGNASYAADRRLMLAKLELADGNPERSAPLLRDVLSAFIDLDQPVELAESILLCASLTAAADPRGAAELLGFGQRLRERASRRLLKTDRERIDSLIVHLQSALGAKEFDGLEHRGGLHSRTTALALARRLLQARLEQEDVVS